MNIASHVEQKKTVALNDPAEISRAPVFSSSSESELTTPFEAEKTDELDDRNRGRSSESPVYEQTEIKIGQPIQHDSMKTILIQVLNAPVGISIEHIDDETLAYFNNKQHGSRAG